MTKLETALEETRRSGLADAVFERLENQLYSDAELGHRVIPDLAHELAVTKLSIALLAAELEWDERGGWWMDALEDGTDSLEWICALFAGRYGGTREVWEAYVLGVLEDRAASV